MWSDKILTHGVVLSLSLGVVLWWPTASSVRGQEMDVDSRVEKLESNQLALAQQPAPPREVDTAAAAEVPPSPAPPPPLPPPAAAPEQGRAEPERVSAAPPRRALASRSPILRLASVPNMLGDFFDQGAQARTPGGPSAMADLPTAGGGRRVKIAENNKALPMNRCYFMYQHFHNALDANPNLLTPGAGRAFSVDRYTIGLEKTFFDHCWSVDVRMPFSSDYGMATDGFAVEGGEIGNLAIIVKRLLVANECGAVAAGMGIDVPTGSDVEGLVTPVDFTLHNDAVHLSPYVGFLYAPTCRLFCLGFAQVDVATGGNRVDYVDTRTSTPGTFGKLTEQTLLYLDLSTGYWLYRNPCGSGLTGLASMVEFHYTTTLQDADVVSGDVAGANFQFGNFTNRLDVVNLTVGLQAEISGCTSLRVGGIFPLDESPERPFDAEFHVSLDRRF